MKRETVELRRDLAESLIRVAESHAELLWAKSCQTQSTGSGPSPDAIKLSAMNTKTLAHMARIACKLPKPNF